MRVKDALYFSPKYRYIDLDFTNPEATIAAFRDRVEGFYLSPAKHLLEHGHVFAVGVVCTAVIDLLARYSLGGRVGMRFSRWVTQNISDFSRRDPSNPAKTLADRLYEDFRCGLIHEGRIKQVGQFSLEADGIVQAEESVIVVNPELLLLALHAALAGYCRTLETDSRELQRFIGRLREDFEAEVDSAGF